MIEEAPAPGMDAATRKAVCGAAVRAAQAVDYVGAGTIEFIADASEGLRADRIWFMEMNTRLQVEHPVTEEITRQDLVEWQLRVASGEPLPLRQDELAIHGWAMEARLYAEDPAKGFLPSVGPLDAFSTGSGVRVDTGVEEGAAISPFYDPMIAKVIAHGPDREDARTRLRDALADTTVWPIRANAGFLVRALDHPVFVAGEVDTGLIARDGDALLPDGEPSDEALSEAAAALAGDRPLFGFRLNAAPRASVAVLVDDMRHEVNVDMARDPTLPLIGAVPEDTLDRLLLTEEGQTWAITPDRAGGSAAGPAADGAILAPMPGRITSVAVSAGQAVTAGQKLVALEAMKMEHALTAPFDGTVAELNAGEGAQVSEGALLVRVERSE